jgi:hypothetical protein
MMSLDSVGAGGPGGREAGRALKLIEKSISRIFGSVLISAYQI